MYKSVIINNGREITSYNDKINRQIFWKWYSSMELKISMIISFYIVLEYKFEVTVHLQIIESMKPIFWIDHGLIPN